MNEWERVNKSAKIEVVSGLKDSLPQVFEDGKVNFERLKDLLTGEILKKEDDRFYFNWAGKGTLFRIIQTPAYGTLKPSKKMSNGFDNTENIVIVGENLEVLKLLLKPYFGRVKMIYIDPPYNTGKDFIFRDNFREPLRDYLEKTGQTSSEGSKLTTNTETSGRYHSDWLNFMYPRLYLARSLLKKDGVMFVSIDDHEIDNLMKMMDEIFGEENFRNCVIVRRGAKSVQAQFETIDSLSSGHEYVVIYTREPQSRFKKILLRSEKYNKGGWNNHWRGTDRPTMRYELFGIIPQSGQWRWGKERSLKAVENYKMVLSEIGKSESDISQEDIDNWYLNKTEELDVDRLDLLRLSNNRKPEHYVPPKGGKLLSDNWMDIRAGNSNEILRLFGKKVFDNPKSLELLKRILEFGTNHLDHDIVLDFFAGSGTTGHAVWSLNIEDGGNRRFILVNLDEEVKDEEIKKEYPTVADICMERLRRASKEIKSDAQKPEIRCDFGFKVFNLAKSCYNLKDEFEMREKEDDEQLRKEYLEWLGKWIDEPLVKEWKPIDVVYEVILKEGLDLNSRVEAVKIGNNHFFRVIDNAQNMEFYITIDEKIAAETIKEVRTETYRNKMFVFLDKALADNDKINLSAFVRIRVI